MTTPSLREMTGVFAKVGLLSFGGPAAQIALMHRLIVDEKGWLDEKSYLNALNFCMLLPGPEAMQLATYVGWRLHGIKGGLAAGLLFILPGAAVIIALSAIYFHFGNNTLVGGLLFGLKAAVVALVLEALIRVSKRAIKGWLNIAIAVAAFAAIAVLDVAFPWVVLAAALAGWLLFSGAKAEPARSTGASARSVAIIAASGLLIWLGPLAVLYTLSGGGGVFTDLAVFFAKAAIVTFGGAYAVLSYVGDVAVNSFQWLAPREMVVGLGLAETTPGPLILVLLFVGYLAGARLGGIDPLLGGVAGALVTLWFTFVPSFLMIFLGAPFVERIRSMPRLAGALQGITSAVVGVIASLGLWFTVAVFWPQGIAPLPDMLAYFDAAAIVIAVAAGVALLRFHVGLGWVLGGAALAGALVKVSGFG
jgi:chromate transporter